MKKKVKLKGKSFASRLTGISSPIGGISWKPPKDERGMAKALITFLEDRRVLFVPYHMELGQYVVISIQEIRKRITSDLEKISNSSTLGESLRAMGATCRKFLNETQEPDIHSYRMEFYLIDCLSKLRATFGIHIARIAYAYDLEVSPMLETILPAETEGEESLSHKRNSKKAKEKKKAEAVNKRRSKN